MRVHSLSLLAACAAMVCAVPGHAQSYKKTNQASAVGAGTSSKSASKSIVKTSVQKNARVAAVTPAPQAAAPQAAAPSASSPSPAATQPSKAKRKATPAAARVRASINLSSQRMTVSVDGTTRHVFKISSGRRGYRTPTGSYRPQWLSRMHYSKKYNNSPMPHSVFYSGGFAIHATYATGRLGRPASHGCIRLSPANAKKFYRLVQKYGKSRTRISIHGVAPAGRSYAKRKRTRRVKKKYVSTFGAYGWTNAPAQGTAKKRRRPAKRVAVRAKKKSYGITYATTSYTWPGD